MIELIQQLDLSLLLAINGWHSQSADLVMRVLSSNWIWVPAAALVLAATFRRFHWRGLLGLVLGVGLMFAIESAGVQLTKRTVQRMRPCLDVQVTPKLHLPAGAHESRYGFVSAHAAATFAFAALATALLRRRRIGLLLVLWASAVSYSRIYLGFHYPTDVLCGALWGACIGLGIATLARHGWIGERTTLRARKHTPNAEPALAGALRIAQPRG